MVKAKANIRILVSGAIIISMIALACFAFAAETQEDDWTDLQLDRVSNASMPPGTVGSPSINPDTGAVSTPGYAPVTADNLLSGGSYAVQYGGADYSKSSLPSSGSAQWSPAINPPPAVDSGWSPQASQNPGNSGSYSAPGQTPQVHTPSVWTYTPPTPAVPRNYSLITITLPKAQIILGSDFIRRAPDRFLASTLVKLISQIAMNSPTIRIPSSNALGISDSPLIAVVTPRGIAIYALPANPEVNTDRLANRELAPSIQIISSPDYMSLPETGFITISVGDIQATAPVTENISIPSLKPVNSRLSGYTAETADSNYITVVVSPTAVIYIPANKVDIDGAPQTTRPLAAARFEDKTQIPEITISAPTWTDDALKLTDTVSAAPIAQIILGADSIKIAKDGSISIETADIKATAPAVDTAQLPDSPNIAVAITPDGAIYMPEPQAIMLAKNPAIPDQKAQTLIPEITISAPIWTEDTKDGSISIETADIKATAPAVDTAQMPDSPNIAVAITPDGSIYMPDPQMITLAKNPAGPDQKTRTLIPEITISAPVWTENTADIVKINNDGTVLIEIEEIKATAPVEASDAAQMPDSANIAVAITPDGMVYMPKPQTIAFAEKPVADTPKTDLKPIVWSAPEKAPETSKALTKAVEVKVMLSKAKKAVIARIMTLKAKQTIAMKKLAKIAAARITDTKKTIAKYIKFVKMSGNKAATQINKLVKGLIQALRNLGPNEESPVIILDRNNLPAAAADKRINPFGPPLQKIRINELNQDQVPFGALISRNDNNRITNINMYFIDTIKKNAVNYAHTGLSPPHTVSPNSTALLSASRESVCVDSASIISVVYAEFFLFSLYILIKTVSPSLLSAKSFNFKAGDFIVFNQLLKKGGSHD